MITVTEALEKLGAAEVKRRTRNYLASLTRRKNARPPRYAYRCLNGPWAGETVYLDELQGPTPGSAQLRIGEHVGRYVVVGGRAGWVPAPTSVE